MSKLTPQEEAMYHAMMVIYQADAEQLPEEDLAGPIGSFEDIQLWLQENVNEISRQMARKFEQNQPS